MPAKYVNNLGTIFLYCILLTMHKVSHRLRVSAILLSSPVPLLGRDVLEIHNLFRNDERERRGGVRTMKHGLCKDIL